MHRFVWAVLLVPCLALAQPAMPTTFAADAEPLAPDALRERLAGKTFTFKPVVGDHVRLQFEPGHVYSNVGSASDNGKWRTEHSTICIEFRKWPSSCTEARLVGDALYIKRVSTGEVVMLVPK